MTITLMVHKLTRDPVRDGPIGLDLFAEGICNL